MLIWWILIWLFLCRWSHCVSIIVALTLQWLAAMSGQLTYAVMLLKERFAVIQILIILLCTVVTFCLWNPLKPSYPTMLVRGAPIIGQFADNRYQPFDNRHRPLICIGRLFVLVSKTTKMLLNAVLIDDNEVTNDSVIRHVSSSKNYKLVKLRQECYHSTIVPLWLHNRYNMTFIERICVLK